MNNLGDLNFFIEYGQMVCLLKVILKEFCEYQYSEFLLEMYIYHQNNMMYTQKQNIKK